MEVTIPTKLSEVPLYQMVEYHSLTDTDETTRGLKAVSIFLNLPIEQVNKLPIKVINKAIGHIKNILSESPTLQPTFTHRGVKYGFVPNIDELSTGEFIDIEAYQKEPKDLYKVLSVLYRPITTEGQGSRYLIEPYKGKINEDFRDVSCDIAYGCTLFFYRIGKDLLHYSLKYLETRKGRRTKTNLPKNGGGWDLSILQLEGMLQSYNELVNCPFKPLYCGVLTNRTFQNWKDKSLINQENEK